MINTIATQKPHYLSAANKVLPTILKENSHMYLTAKVRDILFDGLVIDCNIKDFAAGAACTQFKNIPTFLEVEKNVFKFSMFGTVIGKVPTVVYR